MAGSARRWSGATKPLSPHTPISEHHGEQESHSMRPRGPLVTNEPSRDHTLDHRWGFIVLAPLAVAALLFLPGIGQRILYSGDGAARRADPRDHLGLLLARPARPGRHDGDLLHRREPRRVLGGSRGRCGPPVADGALLAVPWPRLLGEGPGRPHAALALRRVPGHG